VGASLRDAQAGDVQQPQQDLVASPGLERRHGAVGHEVGTAVTGPKPSVEPEALKAHALSLLALPQMTNEACPVVIISGRVDRYSLFYDELKPPLWSVCSGHGRLSPRPW
jgi:hypothetical protein